MIKNYIKRLFKHTTCTHQYELTGSLTYDRKVLDYDDLCWKPQQFREETYIWEECGKKYQRTVKV